MNFKFLLSIAFFCIISFGFSSCIKDYTCRCTMTYSGAPGFAKTEKDYKVRDTEKNAKNICESNSKEYEHNGIHTKEDCKLF